MPDFSAKSSFHWIPPYLIRLVSRSDWNKFIAFLSQQIRHAKFPGAVTSLAHLDDGRTVLVGCKSGEIHQMEVLTCESTVLSTCHTGAINDIAFPRDLDRCDHYSRLISIHVTKKECNDLTWTLLNLVCWLLGVTTGFGYGASSPVINCFTSSTQN